MTKGDYEPIVYLYMLLDPRGSNLCYVGATTNFQARTAQHFRDYSSYPSNRKCLWIKELADAGLKPAVFILDIVPENESWQAEQELITAMRASYGDRLLNCGVARGRPSKPFYKRCSTSITVKKR